LIGALKYKTCIFKASKTDIGAFNGSMSPKKKRLRRSKTSAAVCGLKTLYPSAEKTLTFDAPWQIHYFRFPSEKTLTFFQNAAVD
jgi:hypothetical protein